MELTEAQLKQAAVQQGRKGGNANVKKHGKKHMGDIARKRWTKKSSNTKKV